MGHREVIISYRSLSKEIWTISTDQAAQNDQSRLPRHCNPSSCNKAGEHSKEYEYTLPAPIHIPCSDDSWKQLQKSMSENWNKCSNSQNIYFQWLLTWQLNTLVFRYLTLQVFHIDVEYAYGQKYWCSYKNYKIKYANSSTPHHISS